MTRGRKNDLIGESGRENSGRSRAAAPHPQLHGAEAEAEPQTLGECSQLRCSIPRGARAGLTILLPAALQRLCWLPVPRGNHQGLVSARHRPVLAEPDACLLCTVTSLSTRVITAWLKIYTSGKNSRQAHTWLIGK